MKLPSVWILTFFLLIGSAWSQDADIVELSSFSVSTETATVSPKPAVAITLTKPATAIVMEVTVLNTNEKADERNRNILAAIKGLQRLVESSAPLRFERREIQLRSDNRRKVLSFSRSEEKDTSFASAAIIAPLDGQADIFALVDRMRSIVASVPSANGSKIKDGAVYLMLEHPESYRKELLTAIFADIAFLKESLGAGFEVLPAGLDGPIHLRTASDKTVELWIDYRLSIRSVLELANPKPAKN